jgi:hypothetical protein
LAKPSVWVKTALLDQALPLVETSKPAGGVAVMLEVRLPPVTIAVEAEAAEATGDSQ